jgi:YegS/Rv2252/BmrU family lipid kinase
MLPAIRQRFEERGGEVRITCRAGDERSMARRSAASGVDTIVALGGDGTWSNVARGILDANVDCRMALLAGGTGNDLAQNVGAPADNVQATLALAFGDSAKRIDVGYVNDTPFVNSCGVGFDVAVVAALGASGSALGKSAYLFTAARLLWRQPAVRATLNGRGAMKDYLVIVIGNGARFGGGMLLAPQASNDDGILDLIAVNDVPALARVRTLLAASAGRHLGLPGVEHLTGTTFELGFESPPRFEADGEIFQADTATLKIRCEARLLKIAVPASA